MLYDIKYLHRECGFPTGWDTPHILKLFGRNPNWLNVTKNSISKEEKDESKLYLKVLNRFLVPLEEKLSNDVSVDKPIKLPMWKRVLGRKLPYHYLENHNSPQVQEFCLKFSPMFSEMEESVSFMLPFILRLLKVEDFPNDIIYRMRKNLRREHIRTAYSPSSPLIEFVENHQESYLLSLEKLAQENTIRYLLLKLDIVRRECVEIHPNGLDVLLESCDGEKVCYSVFEILLGKNISDYESSNSPLDNFFKWFVVMFEKGEWEKLAIPKPQKEGQEIEYVSSRSIRSWRSGKTTMSLKNLNSLISQYLVVEPHNQKKYRLGTMNFFIEIYKVAKYLTYISERRPDLNLYQMYSDLKFEVQNS